MLAPVFLPGPLDVLHVLKILFTLWPRVPAEDPVLLITPLHAADSTYQLPDCAACASFVQIIAFRQSAFGSLRSEFEMKKMHIACSEEYTQAPRPSTLLVQISTRGWIVFVSVSLSVFVSVFVPVFVSVFVSVELTLPFKHKNTNEEIQIQDKIKNTKKNTLHAIPASSQAVCLAPDLNKGWSSSLANTRAYNLALEVLKRDWVQWIYLLIVWVLEGCTGRLSLPIYNLTPRVHLQFSIQGWHQPIQLQSFKVH